MTSLHKHADCWKMLSTAHENKTRTHRLSLEKNSSKQKEFMENPKRQAMHLKLTTSFIFFNKSTVKSHE